MVAPITSIGDTTDIIFINGLYYDQRDFVGQNELFSSFESSLPPNNDRVMVTDRFLSKFLAECKEKNAPLDAVPLELIPTFYRENVSFEDFIPETDYIFDLGTGILWEQKTFAELPIPKKCPTTNQLIQGKNLILHPFASALSSAMKAAKNSGQTTVDINAVFSTAINPNTPTGQIKNLVNKKAKAKDMVLERWWLIFALALIAICSVVSMIGAPWLIAPIFLLMYSLAKINVSSRRFNLYFREHRQVLQNLNIHINRITSALAITNGIAYLVLISLSPPALALSVLSSFAPLVLAGLGLPAGVSHAPLRTAISLMRETRNNPNIPPVSYPAKRNVIARSAARIVIFSGLVATSWLVPVIGVGLLSVAFGPVGLSALAVLGAIVVAKMIINDVIEMHLNQIHPEIEKIESGFDNLNPSPLTFTEPTEIQSLVPKNRVVVQPSTPPQLTRSFDFTPGRSPSVLSNASTETESEYEDAVESPSTPRRRLSNSSK